MAEFRHPVSKCVCLEGRVEYNGALIRFLPAVHDCDYIMQRNALIPTAEAVASASFDRKDPKWGEHFSHEMTRLSRERGLLTSQRPA